jgi:NAD(P)-dependent dehydrogenase (short-subunit alcohol dehydrogenase family)
MNGPRPSVIRPGATLFVTGGAGGIGLAVARHCAELGMNAVLADAHRDRLDEAVRDFPGPVLAVPMDVADPADWERARREAKARFGPIGLLVNGAAIPPSLAPVAELSIEEFDRIIAVNLRGVFLGVQAFARGMAARGDGHIVNIASEAGLFPLARLGAYAAAKYGVVGLSEVLRVELAEAGIGVTVVAPGLVQSNMTIGKGMDPIWVARAIVQGVRTNQAFVITHPNCREAIERRHAELVGSIGDWAQPGYDAPVWKHD